MSAVVSGKRWNVSTKMTCDSRQTHSNLHFDPLIFKRQAESVLTLKWALAESVLTLGPRTILLCYKFAFVLSLRGLK